MSIRRKILFLFSVFVLMADGARAAVLSEDAILRRYSLDQMAAGALVLKVALDGTNLCRLDPETQAQLPMGMEALVQSKLQSLVGAGKLAEEFKLPAKLSGCMDRCRCSFYMRVLEGKEKLLSPESQAALSAIRVRAVGESAAGNRSCAKRNLWFCQSDLLRYLQKSLATDSGGERSKR